MNHKFRMVNNKKVLLTAEERKAREENDRLELIREKETRPLINRAKGFKSIPEQLDLMFHEIKETGSLSKDGAWFKHIAKVKKDNPKNVEEA